MSFLPIAELNGQTVDPPVEWPDISVKASFDVFGIQGSIETQQLTFVGTAAQGVFDRLEAAANGSGASIYEGIPYTLRVQGDLNLVTVADGYIDLNEEFEVVDPTTVKVKFKDDRGLNALQRANGVSYELLKRKGFISQSDEVQIPYVIDTEFRPTDLALLGLSIYTLVRETADFVRELAEFGGTAGGMSAIVPPLGSIGTVIYTAAALAARVIFIQVMFVRIILDIIDLINELVPPIRYHRAVPLLTLLEKGAEYLGYTFDTSIPLISTLYYLPSKKKPGVPDALVPLFNFLQSGLPRQGDFGYTVGEVFELCIRLFDAKPSIDNGVLRLDALINDGFWINQSTYQPPDFLNERRVFNSSDLAARRYYTFEVDNDDDWTIDNYNGTAIEIATEPSQITPGLERNVSTKGLDEVRFPIALGSRKDELNPVEDKVETLKQKIDDVFSNFLLGVPLPPTSGRIGVLKLSKHNPSVPKVIPLSPVSFRVPQNARDFFSAPALWDDYLRNRSWVSRQTANDFGGQQQNFEGIRIPFGVEDWIAVRQNSYFTVEGRVAKIVDIDWNFGGSVATISGWWREPYDRTLEEILIIPEDNGTT